jgi:hypothetical protein
MAIVMRNMPGILGLGEVSFIFAHRVNLAQFKILVVFRRIHIINYWQFLPHTTIGR